MLEFWVIGKWLTTNVNINSIYNVHIKNTFVLWIIVRIQYWLAYKPQIADSTLLILIFDIHLISARFSFIIKLGEWHACCGPSIMNSSWTFIIIWQSMLITTVSACQSVCNPHKSNQSAWKEWNELIAECVIWIKQKKLLVWLMIDEFRL